MRMIAERLPPRLETHLCGFQLASSSCFTTYPLDETVSTAPSDSDNADRVGQDVFEWYVVISGSHSRIRKCLAEAEYGSGMLLLKPIN